MRSRYVQSALWGFLLGFSLLACAGEKGAKPLAPVAFDQCQFSIQKSHHLDMRTTSNGSGEDSYCAIHLGIPSGVFLEASASVIVSGKGLFEKDGNDVGFSQDTNGKWAFAGTDLLLSSKMLKASFMQELSESETLLVGYQLIRGNIAQGGPITVPGIRILRIAPEFLVSVELNFQPTHYEQQNKGYKQLREAVSKELVDIVKSVQFAPGAAGPTVRPVISPINP